MSGRNGRKDLRCGHCKRILAIYRSADDPNVKPVRGVHVIAASRLGCRLECPNCKVTTPFTFDRPSKC